VSRKRYRKYKNNDFAGFIAILLFIAWSQIGLDKMIAFAVLFIGLGVIIGILYRRHKNNILLASGVDLIDKMSGEAFEKFLLVHFKKNGYKGNTTPTTNDYGADLVLEKDGIKTAVQAKRWQQKVGIEAVQQIIGAINYYGASYGMVITNSFFTKSAVNLAAANKVELWDRNKLIDFMSKHNGRCMAEDVTNISSDVHCTVQPKLSSSNTKCTKCGNDMIIKKGKYGKFLGCVNYPECKNTSRL